MQPVAVLVPELLLLLRVPCMQSAALARAAALAKSVRVKKAAAK